jgi:hypothetical protein
MSSSDMVMVFVYSTDEARMQHRVAVQDAEVASTGRYRVVQCRAELASSPEDSQLISNTGICRSQRAGALEIRKRLRTSQEEALPHSHLDTTHLLGRTVRAECELQSVHLGQLDDWIDQSQQSLQYATELRHGHTGCINRLLESQQRVCEGGLSGP